MVGRSNSAVLLWKLSRRIPSTTTKNTRRRRELQPLPLVVSTEADTLNGQNPICFFFHHCEDHIRMASGSTVRLSPSLHVIICFWDSGYGFGLLGYLALQRVPNFLLQIQNAQCHVSLQDYTCQSLVGGGSPPPMVSAVCISWRGAADDPKQNPD